MTRKSERCIDVQYRNPACSQCGMKTTCPERCSPVYLDLIAKVGKDIARKQIEQTEVDLPRLCSHEGITQLLIHSAQDPTPEVLRCNGKQLHSTQEAKIVTRNTWYTRHRVSSQVSAAAHAHAEYSSPEVLRCNGKQLHNISGHAMMSRQTRGQS